MRLKRMLLKMNIFYQTIMHFSAVVKQTDGVDTAIILMAKKQASPWTYEHVINATLLPMIINHEYPCLYNGFSLLGMFIFPVYCAI